MNDRSEPPDPGSLEGHREELAAEFLRVARAEPRSRIRRLLGRRMVVPLLALALGSGAAGVAIAGGESDRKVVPLSYTVGDTVGTAELGVGIGCAAEEQWWDEQIAQGGGSVQMSPVAESDASGHSLVQLVLPEVPADICD